MAQFDREQQDESAVVQVGNSLNRRLPWQSFEDEGATAVACLLRCMEKQMTEHPEEIVAADAAQLQRIGKLVKGVKAG